ncbi:MULTISPECIES: PH domain-containing protein [unclassified Staphylococcus]|uniref:PH domain-containing protein n=1 Tax=unclassified Staphylococcus TaxID=91994 RepID=UPI0021D18539|nr:MULTISPECIES: PH domain-containing protein [unclassified Staphylococcus]UXR75756.1 PH domain-containing protein [Staphylococcus sp. IVB6233]UXR79954.1 PH domain-containing protein [Staphylococcus sp. IVB6218]
MMTEHTYHKMAPEGPKVMRIASVIVTGIAVLIAIAGFITSYFVEFEKMLKWIALGFAVLAVLYAIMFVWLKPIYSYHVFRYHYSEQGIVVREGFIFIEETKVPLFRIQNIDIDEGFIMRKYGLATLTISTAGGNTEIRLIDKQQALKIKQLIQGYATDVENDLESHTQNEITEENYDKIKDTQSEDEEI